MDLMTLRRGLMMTMENSIKKTSGVVQLETSGYRLDIPHGLGTSNVAVLAQLVNDDHANKNSGTRYENILVFGFAEEANVDTLQTYSFNNGTQLGIEKSQFTIYANYGAASGTALTIGSPSSTSYGLFDVDGNSAYFNMIQKFSAGRWVWTAYAIG